MSCICASLEDVEKVERNIDFFKGLPVLEYGNWVKLCQCLECNQLWSVDEWDKGNISFARKLDTNDHWQDIDIEKQKSYLLQARGIEVGVMCKQSGCSQSALNGVAFCVDHFYEMGWRE